MVTYYWIGDVDKTGESTNVFNRTGVRDGIDKHIVPSHRILSCVGFGLV